MDLCTDAIQSCGSSVIARERSAFRRWIPIEPSRGMPTDLSHARNEYARPGRRRHPVAQIIGDVRRLVVGDVLPRDAEPVDGVVHQRGEAMRGGDGRGVYP